MQKMHVVTFQVLPSPKNMHIMKKTPSTLKVWLKNKCFLLHQAARTPRPCSRRPSRCCPAATARSTSTAPSPAACSVPAACSRSGAWTVAAATAVARWCASVPVEAGWFTGSRRGATPAGRSSPLASTPGCLPLAAGYAEPLGATTGSEDGKVQSVSLALWGWHRLIYVRRDSSLLFAISTYFSNLSVFFAADWTFSQWVFFSLSIIAWFTW